MITLEQAKTSTKSQDEKMDKQLEILNDIDEKVNSIDDKVTINPQDKVDQDDIIKKKWKKK